MAKAGSPKNTKNKAKHSKLMAQKKKKEREKKEAHKAEKWWGKFIEKLSVFLFPLPQGED